MKRLSLCVFSICSPFLYAQTNLPVAPAQKDMGSETFYDCQCPTCEREQKLIPDSIKVLKSKTGLGGEIQTCRATFHCINPKCGKEFTFTIQRWIRAPIRLPARPVKQTTNAPMIKVPTPKVVSPKGAP